MKILVTGATGFIGKYVIENLIFRNVDVIATSLEPEISIKHEKLKYISCDLNESKENFFEFFGRPESVIHLSWANLPNYQELFHIEKNLMSNYYFIKNLVSNGLMDVNCIGTCFEYGLLNGCLNEEMETKPSTTYGLAKDTLRRFIEELKKHYSFTFKWMRLFYPYGKGQSPKSLLSQLESAVAKGDTVFNMSAGEQLRDYLPVENVAENIVKLSTQREALGVFNICSGNPVSVRKFVENYIAEKSYNIKLNLGFYPYPVYEPLAFWGDTKKLQRAINEE